MDTSKQKTMEENKSIKSLIDLNTVLFNQLETLDNKELTEEDFQKELERSKSIVSISQTIINNGKLLLDAEKHFGDQSKFAQKVLLDTGRENI